MPHKNTLFTQLRTRAQSLHAERRLVYLERLPERAPEHLTETHRRAIDSLNVNQRNAINAILHHEAQRPEAPAQQANQQPATPTRAAAPETPRPTPQPRPTPPAHQGVRKGESTIFGLGRSIVRAPAAIAGGAIGGTIGLAKRTGGLIGSTIRKHAPTRPGEVGWGIAGAAGGLIGTTAILGTSAGLVAPPLGAIIGGIAAYKWSRRKKQTA